MYECIRSMDLDNKNVVVEVLEANGMVITPNESELKVDFSYLNKEFSLCYFSNAIELLPLIFIRNEEQFDVPHIMIQEVIIEGNSYRSLCLTKNDSIIISVLSFREKIELVVSQLIKLLNLSSIQIEREFQKEFLYYWNAVASSTSPISSFIGDDRESKKLKVYADLFGRIRLVADDLRLNDKNTTYDGKKIWRHQPNISGYYIPIIDSRQILPPFKNRLWSATEIKKIINGRDISRISHETVEYLRSEMVTDRQIFLCFHMVIDEDDINYCCEIIFTNSKKKSLFSKLINDVKSVSLLQVDRNDSYTLSKQIGNTSKNEIGKVLIVGAGSLGSYLANELIKAGILNLSIYDDDTYVAANTFRHTIGFSWSGLSKVQALKQQLERIHPEVRVISHEKRIDDKNIIDLANEHDLVIFTIGNTDTQLLCNKVLSEAIYLNPVIYSWIEAGGVYSHILKINYSDHGCYKCLFTNEIGEFVNNKANLVLDSDVENSTISNGCGGTRAAYGTAVILRTVATLLDLLNEMGTSHENESKLINITPMQITHDYCFIEKECTDCSDKNR